jgi:preprotein translocase subunit SecD
MSCTSIRSLSFAVGTLLAFSPESRTQSPSHPIIELRIARTRAAAGYAPRQLADTTFYVSDSILVSDSDIEHADTSWWEGRLVVPIRLTPRAAKRLADATKNHVRDRMAIFLDGEFTGEAPIVMPINGPTLELEGIGPPTPVDRIAAEITAHWPAHH